MYFPGPTSKYRIRVHETFGGMIDIAAVNSENLIYGFREAGASFQMACFDETSHLPQNMWCGDTQRGLWNPTQAGSCKVGSTAKPLGPMRSMLNISIRPRLFEIKDPYAVADLEWTQRLVPLNHVGNAWSLRFTNTPLPKKPLHPKAHGRYTVFLIPGFDTAIDDKGNGQVIGQAVTSVRSNGYCILCNPRKNLAFGLKRDNLNQEWSVRVNWFATEFGQGAELTHWNEFFADTFQFVFGEIDAVQRMLKTGAY